MNKMFTTVAIARLVERGELSFCRAAPPQGDVGSKHWPGFAH